jgi:23S rRNA pseudouridine1911/1915/1917 synthase
MRVLRVPPELAGMRLDRFVQAELRDTSRTRSQLIIERCAYGPEGERLKKNRRVQANDRVILWRPPWDELAPRLELPVVYEDDELLAINKPPLIPVHPSARFYRSTVTHLIAEQRPDDHLTLLHRIDRETTGVLLLARTRAADRAVKIQFQRRQSELASGEGVRKRYLAMCWNAPAWERQTCELPIEPDSDSPYRVRMRVAAPTAGLACGTSFEVLELRRRGEREYSLISCMLHTGRQHQIRVHLAALGCPIVGDKLYGPDPLYFAKGADGTIDEDDRRVLELDRQALHASDIALDHPVSGERLTIEAPLYPDMETFWEGLDQG